MEGIFKCKGNEISRMINLQIKRVEKEDQIFSCRGKNESTSKLIFFL